MTTMCDVLNEWQISQVNLLGIGLSGDKGGWQFCGSFFIRDQKGASRYQEYLVILFEPECLTCSQAQCVVALYGRDLRWHRASAKEVTKALLAIGTVVEMNL